MTLQDILNQLNDGDLTIEDLTSLQTKLNETPDLRKVIQEKISTEREERVEVIINAFGSAIADVDAPVGVKFVATRVFDEDEQREMWDVTASASSKRTSKSTNSGEGPKQVEGGRYEVLDPNGLLVGTYSSLSTAGRAVLKERGMFHKSCHGKVFWSARSNSPASGTELTNTKSGYRCVVA